MAHALRDRSTPPALASSRQVIEFKGRLADFERLSSIVDDDLDALDAADRPADWQNAPVNARVAFDFADARESLPRVRGRVEARIPAVCQRCLEACEVDVAVDIDYLLLTDGRSVGDAAGYEVWELEEAGFRPSDLVEEVLVMALPVSARHREPAGCGPVAGRIAGNMAGQDEPAGADEGERSKPFAGLRSLLADKD